MEFICMTCKSKVSEMEIACNKCDESTLLKSVREITQDAENILKILNQESIEVLEVYYELKREDSSKYLSASDNDLNIQNTDDHFNFDNVSKSDDLGEDKDGGLLWSKDTNDMFSDNVDIDEYNKKDTYTYINKHGNKDWNVDSLKQDEAFMRKQRDRMMFNKLVMKQSPSSEHGVLTLDDYLIKHKDNSYFARGLEFIVDMCSRENKNSLTVHQFVSNQQLAHNQLFDAIGVECYVAMEIKKYLHYDSNRLNDRKISYFSLIDLKENLRNSPLNVGRRQDIANLINDIIDFHNLSNNTGYHIPRLSLLGHEGMQIRNVEKYVSKIQNEMKYIDQNMIDTENDEIYYKISRLGDSIDTIQETVGQSAYDNLITMLENSETITDPSIVIDRILSEVIKVKQGTQYQRYINNVNKFSNK